MLDVQGYVDTPPLMDAHGQCVQMRVTLECERMWKHWWR
jgi:hypothetical protein